MEKIFFPGEIESERLILKRHTIDLTEQMFRYVDQDRARLLEFLPWVDSTTTVNDEINYIEMTQKQWDQQDSRSLRQRDGFNGEIY